MGQTNFQQDYVRDKKNDSFDTKINVQASQRDQISARFSFLRPSQTDPPIYGVYGGLKDFSGTGTDTTYSTGVNYTHMWSSTLVMEARGGLNYFHNTAVSSGDGLLTAQELLASGAVPSREKIREHISGNYCRCTGYHAIVDAIEAVARQRAGGGK